MKKRILPALLALCMVMSLLPVAVFADEDPTECEYVADSHESCTFTGDTHKTGCPQKCTHVGSDGEQDCTKTKAEGKQLCATHQAEADAAGDDDDDGDDTPEVVICATCGCEVTATSDCTVSGKFEAAETACAHDGEDETGGSRDATCKYAVCTNMDCTKYGKNVLKTHTHDDVSAGNCSDGGEFNSKKENCEGGTHYDGCPMKCTVAGCGKVKTHTDKHETNTTCTNDAQCAMAVNDADAIAKHVSTCPALADASVDEGKVLYTYVKTYDVADDGVTCQCTTTAHGHEATCGKALTGTYSISVTVAISEDLTDKAEKDAAAEEAGSSQITSAKGDALDAWKADRTIDGKVLCDDCIKAIDNASTSACTGKEDCDPNLTAHKKDCLSLCTMSGSCKNSVGKSEAHQVWYRVELIVSGGPNTAKGTYADRADAVALLSELRAAAVEAETTDRYQLVAVHCPQAGVADSVMVAADETPETTEPATPDEPKAPTKAEDFADLNGGEWYAEELTALVEKGIFTGSLDDGKYSFNATGEVTGAELVVLLSRVAGEDLVTTGAEWNKAATAWAAEAGYTEGVDITTTGKLTRQDVVLILWRAAGSPDSEQSLEAFPDAEGLEGDYLTAMKWAVEKEIIKGDGDSGALKAEDNITRAEMVAVLTRYSNVK